MPPSQKSNSGSLGKPASGSQPGAGSQRSNWRDNGFYREWHPIHSRIRADEYRALKRLAVDLDTTIVDLTTVMIRAGLDPANREYMKQELAEYRQRKS